MVCLKDYYLRTHTNYFAFKFSNIFEAYLQCDCNTSIRIGDVICVLGNCLDRCSHTHSVYSYYSSSFYGRYYYQCNRGSMHYRSCGLNQSFYPGLGRCGSYTILVLDTVVMIICIATCSTSFGILKYNVDSPQSIVCKCNWVREIIFFLAS